MPNNSPAISQREEPAKNVKKKNLYISYIKGVAIIGITLIHLFDWSNMELSFSEHIFKDLLHICVFFFVLTTGSVLLIAYRRRTTLDQVKRLFFRGAQILSIYYLYSLVKLAIFDFSTEPLYYQYINKGTFKALDILLFRSSSVPLAILADFAFFLFLSPLFLLIDKKAKHKEFFIMLLIALLFIINYLTPIPSISNGIVGFLYGRDNVLFPIALWLIPLLVGFFLAQTGFEKQKGKILLASGTLTAISASLLFFSHKSLWIFDNEFPLSPYYTFLSVFALSLLLYLFRFLEKLRYRSINVVLAILRFLGDSTLQLFVFQWIVIDLSRWIYPDKVTSIWLSVPLFFCAYLLFYNKKLVCYYQEQKEADSSP